MVKMWRRFRTQTLESRLQMTKQNTGGFHSAVRCTLLCSRWMGLFPLTGLSAESSSKLRFTLRCPYTIIYITSLFGQGVLFIMSLYWLIQKGISLSNVTNSFFYSSSLTSLLLLINIGRYWPSVIREVEAIEADLPPFSRDVTRICNVTMACTLLAALVEHLLSIFYGVTVAFSCEKSQLAKTYFSYNAPWIFEYTPYVWWKGVMVETFNIQSTFIWSFNDLLVMVISIYLTEHLILHNQLLRTAAKQEHFIADVFRVQYLKIVRLVQLINGQIGIYILTSFGSNLYWICTQLFYSLNKNYTGHFIACNVNNPNQYEPLHGIEHTIYFTYSFSFLVARTLLVLLLAARINSNSTMPLVTLYDLPSERFDIEVERFIAQINNIKVALSGLDFFYVTRTMILTLLGTIVTYELVLLQFNK